MCGGGGGAETLRLTVSLTVNIFTTSLRSSGLFNVHLGKKKIWVVISSKQLTSRGMREENLQENAHNRPDKLLLQNFSIFRAGENIFRTFVIQRTIRQK